MTTGGRTPGTEALEEQETVGAERATAPPTGAPPRVRGSHDRAIELAILVGFAIVVGLTILRHEMWRDELQAWTLTRSSTGLRDLLHNLRFEGHPALWYLLLYPLTRWFDGPEAMQALQYAIAVATMTVIVYRAPFTLLQKGMVAFGYFLVFEYGTLSRSYALGVLLLVVACAVAARSPRNVPLVGLLLGLVALTSAFGAILAVAVGGGLLVDELARRRSDDPRAASPQSLAIGAAVALGGLLVAYAQSIPPENAGEYRGWRTDLDAGEMGSTIASVWRAFVPIPHLEREFWNTNVLDGRVTIAAILSLGLIGLVAATLRAKPGALVAWGLGLGGILVFLYAKIGYSASGRHYGHIFLLLLAVSWLAPSMATTGEDRGGRARPAELRAVVLTVVLVMHLFAGAFAVALDWTTPFSDGRAVARYLQTNGLDAAVIIGYPDTSASTVAGYLQRQVYYPQGGRFGSYVIWDTDRSGRPRPLADVIADVLRPSGPTVLVLRTAPLDDLPPDLRLLATFDDGIVADEHYWLYEVDRG